MDIIDTITLKRFNGNDVSFPYHGIWLFTGSQGLGKTLTLISHLRSIHRDYPNTPIVSDIPLFGIPYTPFVSDSQFDKDYGTNGVIFVLDEIHTIYSSQESRFMTSEQLAEFCQNRKKKRLILGTSQRFCRVAKPIREQTIYHYAMVKSLFGILYGYRRFNGWEYDDDGIYLGEKPKIDWYYPNSKTYLSYDTNTVVRGFEIDVEHRS